jgi:hypothetical protein
MLRALAAQAAKNVLGTTPNAPAAIPAGRLEAVADRHTTEIAARPDPPTTSAAKRRAVPIATRADVLPSPTSILAPWSVPRTLSNSSLKTWSSRRPTTRPSSRSNARSVLHRKLAAKASGVLAGGAAEGDVVGVAKSAEKIGPGPIGPARRVPRPIEAAPNGTIASAKVASGIAPIDRRVTVPGQTAPARSVPAPIGLVHLDTIIFRTMSMRPPRASKILKFSMRKAFHRLQQASLSRAAKKLGRRELLLADGDVAGAGEERRAAANRAASRAAVPRQAKDAVQNPAENRRAAPNPTVIHAAAPQPVQAETVRIALAMFRIAIRQATARRATTIRWTMTRSSSNSKPMRATSLIPPLTIATQ